MKRLTLTVLFLCLCASFAQAQSVCPINAGNAFTGQGGFVERCGFNPYNEFASKVNSAGRICASDGPLGNALTILTIGEVTIGRGGIGNAPGADLGYILLVNPLMEAQDVTVELMFTGDNTTTYVQRITMGALSNAAIGLHDQPLYFGCGERRFLTNVYFSKTGTAEVKVYTVRDPSHPLDVVTLDKMGQALPAAR